MYDYLIVGAGLCGAVIARKLTDAGKSCLVIDRREVTGGNIRTENISGIDVHVYGAHIFHTSDEEVWQFVNKYVSFNNFINSPIANYKGEVFNLPFNMNTFNELWGVITPEEAKRIIESQRIPCDDPQNLEEFVLNAVGPDIYEMLIKGYTEKQWGRPCRELDVSIIKRIPLRFTYDNNYFSDRYQGIPIEGYNTLISRLLEGIEVVLGSNYTVSNKVYIAKKVIYTGALDEYYEYCFGRLEYRSLMFLHYEYPVKDYQGNAVVNYTSKDVPYTRKIEHKHFSKVDTESTIVTEEYPKKWTEELEKFYPIDDKRNNTLYTLYRRKAEYDGLLFAGRLAEYKYYDMDDTVRTAIDLAERELKNG